MSQKSGTIELHFKYKGMFELAGLLSLVTDWMQTRGFQVTCTKVKHKSKTFGIEDEYEIKGWLDETDFHRMVIEYNMHMWDANEVEVIVGGQKRKLIKARFYVSLTGYLEIDPYDRYENSMFAKGLRRFLMEKVLFYQYDTIYMDKLFYKLHELQNNMKEFLDMQSKGKYYKNMW